MIDKTKHEYIHSLYNTGIKISPKEENTLFSLYKTETNKIKKARIKDKIIRANIRFALSTALRLAKNVNVSKINDIVAEALLGMMVAIESYDNTRDVKFISYAVWHIKQKVFHYLDNDDLIHIPAPKKSKALKALKAGNIHEFDIDPELKFIYNSLQNIVSVDEKIGDDDGDCISDTIPDTEMVDTISYNTKQIILNKIITETTNRLNNTEQLIISDMLNGIPMKNTAITVNLSKQRINQLRLRILDKMGKNITHNELFQTHKFDLINK